MSSMLDAFFISVPLLSILSFHKKIKINCSSIKTNSLKKHLRIKLKKNKIFYITSYNKTLHGEKLPRYRVIFFFFHVGCPGQLTRTTTIPHGPLDILQAQEQVRHRGGDRRAQRGSNPGGGRNKSTMDHSS